MLPAGFGEVAERLRRSTVQVHVANGRQADGSGVIWNPEGLIVTNAHVARERRAVVELWDGRRLEANVVSSDTRGDLAALRTNARDLPAATPGDSSALRAGELVIAVGNPLGFAGALSTGVVHALGRVPGLGSQPWVQADVRLAPGNSGGPLADARGRVVGINAMIVRGLGLAVPSNRVADFLKRGPAGPRLGVTLRPVRGGLLVLEVAPGSPAEAASLMVGDLIPTTLEELRGLAGASGATLRLPFRRGDRSRPREAVLQLRRPTPEAA